MKKDNLSDQYQVNEQIRAREVRIVGDALGGSNVAWFMLNNNKDLRDAVNKAIKVMHEDGSLSELCLKWFKMDLTGYISDKWPIATK